MLNAHDVVALTAPLTASREATWERLPTVTVRVTFTR
jgi:hypothetical protein